MRPSWDEYWLAGFWEGEGSFSLYFAKNGRPELRCLIASTDKDVIEKAFSIMEYGSMFDRSSKTVNGKTMHCIGLSGNKIGLEFINRMYPLMGERRRNKIDEIRTALAGWTDKRKRT